MGIEIDKVESNLCLSECITANLCELTNVGVVDVVANGESVVLNNVAYLTIPTKLSDLENDVEYINREELELTLTNYATKSELTSLTEAITEEATARERADTELAISIDAVDTRLTQETNTINIALVDLRNDLALGLSEKQNILTPGVGISIDNYDTISLNTADFPETSLIGASSETQANSKLIMETDEGYKKVASNKLDYNKIKVVEQEDPSLIEVNDFLFIKNK